MPTPGGPTMYRPYRTCVRGRIGEGKGVRVWGSSHHDLDLAIKRAQQWHNDMVSLSPEFIYFFDWCVIDTRADTVVWQWEQL